MKKTIRIKPYLRITKSKMLVKIIYILKLLRVFVVKIISYFNKVILKVHYNDT